MSDSCKFCGSKNSVTVCRSCGHDFYEDPKDRYIADLEKKLAEAKLAFPKKPIALGER